MNVYCPNAGKALPLLISVVRTCCIVALLGSMLSACGENQSRKTKMPSQDSLALRDSAIYRLYDPVTATKRAYQLDTFFRNLHKKRGFNGTVLIAQYGRVLYRGAFGYADFKAKDTLSTQTSFQLASVSKQFTAVAIMMLKEKGKLSYEDEVQKYFPQFPYTHVTIRHLLTHRSGLPNYMYEADKHFTDRQTPVSNGQVINLLTEYKPEPYFSPDTRFNYSNTGYSLLASIVEKVSGMTFTHFMQRQVFAKLKMNHTFIYKGADSLPLSKVATGYTAGKRKAEVSYLDGVVGDKGVYSTVEDLYKWDRALYTERLVKQATLEEAFTPASRELKTHNYGFGWRLRTTPEGDPIIFHGGWWHGFKTYFMRNRKDHSTVIILSNVANGSVSHVKSLQPILYPYDSVPVPKPLEGDTLQQLSLKKQFRAGLAGKIGG